MLQPWGGLPGEWYQADDKLVRARGGTVRREARETLRSDTPFHNNPLSWELTPLKRPAWIPSESDTSSDLTSFTRPDSLKAVSSPLTMRARSSTSNETNYPNHGKDQKTELAKNSKQVSTQKQVKKNTTNKQTKNQKTLGFSLKQSHVYTGCPQRIHQVGRKKFKICIKIFLRCLPDPRIAPNESVSFSESVGI